MSTTAAAPPARAPPGLTRLARLPSLEQIRAKIAPAASSPSPATGDGRLGISSLPARPSSTPPPDGPALRSLLGRHPPSAPSQRHASSPSPSGTSVVCPQLAGRRASSVTGPSLEAIRERVGNSAAARLMGSGPPQITLTEVDSLETTEVSHYDAGGRSGSTTPRVETMDEDRAQQLRGRDLPLQHVWSWTYTPPMPSHAASTVDAYSSALVALGKLRTVQDWAKHANHIPPPSSLTKGANYGLFRSNIQPIFEDVQHKQGGRWVLTLRGLSVEHSAKAIDRCWSEVMMALVGGVLPTEGEAACSGAVVGIRHRGDRLQLWTTSKVPTEPIQNLGESLFQLLQPSLDSVRAIGGGYMLDFQVNFPSPGSQPRFRGWNSDMTPPPPLRSNAGWR